MGPAGQWTRCKNGNRLLHMRLILAGWDGPRLFTAWHQDVIKPSRWRVELPFEQQQQQLLKWAVHWGSGLHRCLTATCLMVLFCAQLLACSRICPTGVNVHPWDWWPWASFAIRFSGNFWGGSRGCGGCASYTFAVKLFRGRWYIWLMSCLQNMYRESTPSDRSVFDYVFIWF